MKLNLWIRTSFPVYKSYTLTCEVFFLLQNIGCADVLFTYRKALSYSLFPQLSQDDSSSWVSPNYKYNSYLFPCFIHEILKSCKYNSQPYLSLRKTHFPALKSPGKIILQLFHTIMPTTALQRSQSELVWAGLVTASLAAQIRCFSCCQALCLCIIRQ